MLGFGEDAGRFRMFRAEGHLLKIPLGGDSCWVLELPRYVPWTAGAVVAVAAAGFAAWRLMSTSAEDVRIESSAAKASRSRLASTAAELPRVARRARGASTPARRPAVRRR